MSTGIEKLDWSYLSNAQSIRTVDVSALKLYYSGSNTVLMCYHNSETSGNATASSISTPALSASSWLCLRLYWSGRTFKGRLFRSNIPALTSSITEYFPATF